MKPFNLERALAGDPVVTRDGRPVTEIHHFKTMKVTAEYPIAAVVDGNRTTHTLEGEYHGHGDEHPGDLFMAPKEKTYWVNVYNNPDGVLNTGGPLYNSKAEAEAKSVGRYLGTFPITITE